MSIMGDILKCFKPDDCDVSLNLEANILHLFPSAVPSTYSVQIPKPHFRVQKETKERKEKTGRDKVSGIVIT